MFARIAAQTHPSARRHLQELRALVVVLNVDQIVDALNASLGAASGAVLVHVWQLKQRTVFVPHSLNQHLAELHRRERGGEPAR